MFGKWVVRDEEYWVYERMGMCDVGDVACWGYGVLRMWDVGDEGC